MVVIRQVPGLVCITCGEEYPNEEITQSRFFITEYDVRAGFKVDIREYQAACTYL
ncbi:MAG: YgiT-type zinc finger protein [Methanospirillaceae archaeon]|nr:YgiT-type zinc finger protein [Methanospirillaceae archaeon]